MTVSFTDVLGLPEAKPSWVGQEGLPGRIEVGWGDSKLKYVEVVCHVRAGGWEGKNEGVCFGPKEGEKRKYSWAEKGKWVGYPRPSKKTGKRRVKKIWQPKWVKPGSPAIKKPVIKGNKELKGKKSKCPTEERIVRDLKK